MPKGMLRRAGGPDRTSLLLVALTAVLLLAAVASAALAGLYASSGNSSPALLLVAAGPVSILAVLVVVLALSRPEGVEEVFLVHDSGLLLLHFSKTVRPEKDRDIVVGMLTAVQGFIREAFPKGGDGNLKLMDFGERRILLCKGSYAYLAVVVHGRVPAFLSRRLRRSLAEVEQTYRAASERWTGSPDALRGADDLLFESLLGDELRQGWTEFKGLLSKLFRAVTRQRLRLAAAAPAERAERTDPRIPARKLMEAEELLAFKAEYREMMMTTLQEIRDGRLTLVGFGNLYMTIATQKNPKPAAVGWWEMMMWTMREVLRTWPWDPETQAWVSPAETPVRARAPPASIPSPAASGASEQPEHVAKPSPLEAEAPADSA